jgi:sigma-E factor negative regulatory protein RseA
MESVSTLMDGELNVDEASRQIVLLKSDEALRERWDTYHLIGDAIRGSAAGRPGFASRVSERLAQEPTVLAPPATTRPPVLVRKVQSYFLPIAASVAAVAVVAWTYTATIKTEAPGQLAKGISSQPQQQIADARPATAPVTAPQQAAAPTAPVPAPTPTPVASEPGAEAPAEPMQEYLLAHQGISPSTAFQGVAPYIRTVSGNND